MRLLKPIALCICLLMAGCSGGSQKTYIKIKGSETVLPISLELAELFTTTPNLPDVSVTAGGSGVGIAALLEDNTDIAMASRAMKFQEKARFKAKGMEYVEVVVAFDALALIVHKDNPVDTLTLEQVQKIFTGEITNWQQVGGNDQDIVAFNRESSSGTYGFFKKKVLKGLKFGSLQSVGANGELVEKVSDNPQTIGYVGIAYADPSRVKPIAIYNPELKKSVAPSIPNAMNESYPLNRPLFYYYLAEDRNRLQPIFNYLLSQEGQEMVYNVGYPPNPEYYQLSQDPEHSPQ